MPRKNTDRAYQLLLEAVQKHAEEDAQGDLAFVGEAPFKDLTPEQTDRLKKGLVHFARAGAYRALAHARVNSYLADQFLPS